MSTFTAGQVLAAAQMNTAANDTGWVDISYTQVNGWMGVAYYRMIGQVVTLIALPYAGTGGATAFTLPSGARPAQTLTFAVWDSTAGTAKRVQIDTSGNVIPQTGTDRHEINCISFVVN